jgi:hypothetical protein
MDGQLARASIDERQRLRPRTTTLVALVSVSALFDGATGAVFDGSRSGSGTRLRWSGMGIGYQREIT